MTEGALAQDGFAAAARNIPRGLSLEMRERIGQHVRSVARRSKLDDLKIARARLADVLSHHSPWIESNAEEARGHELVQACVIRGEVIHQLIQSGHRHSPWLRLAGPTLPHPYPDLLSNIRDDWQRNATPPDQPPPWHYRPLTDQEARRLAKQQERAAK